MFDRLAEPKEVVETYQDAENESFGAQSIKYFMEQYLDDYGYFAYLSGESEDDPVFLHNVEHLLTIDPSSLPNIIGDALPAPDYAGYRQEDDVLANIDRVVSTLCEIEDSYDSYWSDEQCGKITAVLSGKNFEDDATEKYICSESELTLANLFKDQSERGTLPNNVYGFTNMDLNRSYEIHGGTVYSIDKRGWSGFMCNILTGRYVIVHIYQLNDNPQELAINMFGLLSKALYDNGKTFNAKDAELDKSTSEAEKLCILKRATNDKNEFMLSCEVTWPNGKTVQYNSVMRTERFMWKSINKFGYLMLICGDDMDVSTRGFDLEVSQERLNKFRKVAKHYLPKLKLHLVYGEVGDSGINVLNVFDMRVQRAFPKDKTSGLMDIPSILFADKNYACTLNPMTYMSQLHLVFWPLKNVQTFDREYFGDIVTAWLHWLVEGNTDKETIEHVREICNTIRIAKDANGLVHVLVGELTLYTLEYIANTDDDDDAIFKKWVRANDDSDGYTSGKSSLSDEGENFGPFGVKSDSDEESDTESNYGEDSDEN